MKTTSRLFVVLTLAGAVLTLPFHLMAEDWNVTAGNWNDPGNWTPASVPSGTPANINNGGTATLDSVVSNAKSVLITNASTLDFLAGGDLTLAGVPNNDHLVVNSGTLNMSGGTFNMNGQHLAADPGGIVNLTGGTFTNAGWFHQSGGTATVNFTNPANSAQFSALFVGRNGPTGVTDVLSGTLKATGWGEIGQNNSTGTLNVTGPDSHVEVFTSGEMDNFFRVGSYGGHGFVNVTGGGTLDTHGGWLTLGDTNGGPDGVGEAFISGTGSTLTSRGLIVGWNGATSVGRLTIEDNAVVNNTVHELSVGRDNPTTAGYVNINSGGVLNAGPETRIGHNGFGQVNIDGGTLNMQGGGWAILGEGGAANGTLNMSAGAVNITADRFVLGQNAGSVGVYNQTGGATNVGNEFNVGRGGGTGTMNLEGGTFNVHGWTTLGRDGPGTGTINVSNGATFTHNELGGDFLVGWTNGSHGDVNVTTGAQMTYNWWIRMGIEPGSTGNLVVDSPGTLLDHNNGTGGDSRIVVGESGLGTMLVSNEAQVNDGGNGFFVGWHAGGNGTVVVNSGAGLAVKSGWIQVGIEAGSVGEVTFDGAGTTVTHDIASLGYSTAIGQSGTGILTISNGAVMNDTAARFLVGRDNGGVGTVNVTDGGTLLHLPTPDPNNEDWMMIVGGTHEPSQPVGGRGLMNVLGGSVVQTNSFDAGRRTPNGGTLNVTDSAFTASGHFSTGRGYDGVGASTPGAVNLTNSSLGYGAWLSVGHEGGNGVMNITDSTITGNGDFNVGIDQNGAPSPTTGVVNMGGGSSITVPTMPIGRNGGTGTFNLNGGLVTVTNEVNVGRGGAPTLGTLNVDGAGSTFLAGTVGDPFMFVGRDGGHGLVNVSNGGTLSTTNTWYTMGNADNSLGETTVTGTGSTLTSVGLIVGWNLSGEGKLNIQDNAIVTNTGRETSIGRDHPNTKGTITIDTGGVLNAGPETRIGHSGIGIVNIDNGTMNMQGGGWAILGEGGAANGTLSMTSGAVNVSADRFVLGQNAGAVGTYNQSGGATQVNNEFNVGRGGATGSLNQSGGTFNVNGWTTLGRDGAGNGTIEVSNGAVFTHLTPNSGDFLVGWSGGSTANVNIIDGGSMTQSWWTRLAVDPGATANMLVDNGSQFIGGLRISDGAAVERGAGRLIIGEDGFGTATISNGSSLYWQGAEVRVAWNENVGANLAGPVGVLNVSDSIFEFKSVNDDGTVANGNFGIAENIGNGTVNLTNAVMNISAWSFFTGWNQVNCKATINMTDSVVNVPNDTGDHGRFFLNDVGQFAAGGGTILNQEGGLINVGAWGAVGRERGGDAVYNLGVNGGAGGMNVATDFYVGRQSHGTINMGTNSSLQTGGVLNLAQENSPTTPSSGTVNNDGGFVTVGSEFNIGRNGGPGNVASYSQSAGMLTTNGEIFVGRDATQGTLSLTGGLAQVNSNLCLGQGGGGSKGTLNLDGPGTVMTVNGWTTLGRDTGGAPTISKMTVKNGALFQHLPSGGGDFLGGWQNGTTATIEVSGGGQMIQNWWFRLGIDPGSTSNMLVDGAGSSYNQNTGRIYVGERGVGSLTISNGATFTQTNGDIFNVGGNDGSANGEGDGTLTVTDGTVSTNNMIRVGFGNTGADPAVGVLNLNSGSVNAGGWIGFGHEGGDGVLNMTGGAISFGSDLYVGVDDNGHTRTTTGKASISGGSITGGAGLGFVIGRNGGLGLVELIGTDPITLSASNESHIGQGGVGAGGSNGNGTLNIDNPNASFTVANGFYIGQDGGTGVVNQTAGTVNETNQWLTLGVGGGSNGTYNLIDGALNANVIEVGADGVGTLNVIAGTAIANAITVGTRSTGVGVVNVSGGLLQSNDHISLGGDQTFGAGTLNLTGGVVQSRFIVADAGVPFAYLNGGTLRAGANEGDFLRNFTPANSEIDGGGVTIDSNGFSITAQNEFDGSGALTKAGAGTLKLTADNIYAGGTSVTGGNLYVSNAAGSGTGPGDVTVSGASSVLGGFGTVAGSVAVSSGGSIAPGESIGILTVQTNVSIDSSSSLRIEINDANAPTNDTLTVTNNLNITGSTLAFTVTGALAQPVYVIANYGTLIGTFGAITGLPDGCLLNHYKLDYVYNAGTQIALVQQPDPFDTWVASFGLVGADAARSADPDKDGYSNLLEFALGGSAPNSGGELPPSVPSLDGTNHFVVSILVRQGAELNFSGTPVPTTSPDVDYVNYQIEGTTDLTTWGVTPMELTTLAAGLDPEPAGYKWVSFRHVNPITSGNVSSARVRVNCN